MRNDTRDHLQSRNENTTRKFDKGLQIPQEIQECRLRSGRSAEFYRTLCVIVRYNWTDSAAFYHVSAYHSPVYQWIWFAIVRWPLSIFPIKHRFSSLHRLICPTKLNRLLPTSLSSSVYALFSSLIHSFFCRSTAHSAFSATNTSLPPPVSFRLSFMPHNHT